MLVAFAGSAVIARMCEGLLYLPAVSIARPSATVVGAILGASIPSVRSEQVDANRSSDSAQRVAIVGIVAEDHHGPESRATATGVAELLKKYPSGSLICSRRRSSMSSE